MKYFIITSNVNEEMQAARLIREIRRNDIRAEFHGIGGEYLQSNEINIIKSYKEFSFGGSWWLNAVYKKRTLIKEVKQYLYKNDPNVLILVSSSKNSIKIASYAKRIGVKTCCYFIPKIGKENGSGINKIGKVVDKILVTLPSELDYYKRKNFDAEYVGNPVLDSIKEYSYDPRFEIDRNETTIAVLSGCKSKEITAISKIIDKISKSAPTYRFLIAASSKVGAECYLPFKKMDNTEIFFDKTYDIVKRSNAAIVTSGIASLETGLLNCPQVVTFHANSIQTLLSKLKIKTKLFSAVNLIAQKEIVREFSQEERNSDKLLAELNRILSDHQYCASMMQDYQELLDKIGAESSSRNAARVIAEWLEEN